MLVGVTDSVLTSTFIQLKRSCLDREGELSRNIHILSYRAGEDELNPPGRFPHCCKHRGKAECRQIFGPEDPLQ